MTIGAAIPAGVLSFTLNAPKSLFSKKHTCPLKASTEPYIQGVLVFFAYLSISALTGRLSVPSIIKSTSIPF